MEIRVIVGADGDATVETISALEDLWHDFQFFKGRAIEFDEPAKTPMHHLRKRFG